MIHEVNVFKDGFLWDTFGSYNDPGMAMYMALLTYDVFQMITPGHP